ncbi:MAG: OmpA family protein [Bacteroidales bacterium]|nr:OmpA family protein [Bacteroidales bacterium]
MKKYYLIFLLITTYSAIIAQNEVDSEWSENYVLLKNSSEGEYLIRIGDVDNLGFGWEDGFNPFKGGTTNSHNFPWDMNPNDVAGMDRILLPSSYKGKYTQCGSDGYSNSYDPVLTRPQIVKIPLHSINNASVKEAILQVFIDDFQAPTFCSRFSSRVNGIEFKELNAILNKVDQTGPVGKLVSVKIPAYLLPELKKDTFKLYIDDPYTASADGFAIDFVRLIINPKIAYSGEINGNVYSCVTDEELKNASVEIRGFGSFKSDENGKFSIKNVPAGYYVVKVSAANHQSQYNVIDVVADAEPEILEFCLGEEITLDFNGNKITDEEQINLNKVQFAAASTELTPDSYKELDLLVDFMKKNEEIKIELSGFTSSEGDEQENIQLSLERVNACKRYIVEKGISENRVFTIGFGPANPIAPNDSQTGRLKNRRVEFGIKR